MSMSNISVIVCTHNPRQAYLRRVVESLKYQSMPADRWELLLIDNLSNPPISEQVDLSWHSGARIVVEAELGLTSARLRGIRDARGDLLVFVDDDNVLDPDYLEVAWDIATNRPFLGAWSGQSCPEFEEKPPEWTRKYWGNLAIREFDEDRWSNMPYISDSMPCGAGLCVRRSVADIYLQKHDNGERQFHLDRKGTSLVSGGDDDLALCACEVGLGLGLISTLKLKHLIPRERLEIGYFCRLAEGIAYSSIRLDHLRGKPILVPTLSRRIVNKVRLLLMSPKDSTMCRSAHRGRKKAIREIKNL